MRAGGGKQKGATWERYVSEALSLWITRGASADCFWRSAMSGGRATVAKRKGKALARQAGDITATAPEGNAFTAAFYIECKHVADLRLQSFFFGKGTLHKFWEVARREAKQHARRPLIIAKQNMMPPLAIFQLGDASALFDPMPKARMIFRLPGQPAVVMVMLDDMLEAKPSAVIAALPARKKLKR